MQRSVRLGVASLGITAFVTQVIALREFLTLFAGNELVIGVMLGNWMLLTGLGSFLGRRPGPAVSPVRKIILCQAASALLSPALLVAIRLVKQFFLQGIQPGIGAATIVSIALLAPCCLLSGFLLTRFGGLVADREGAAKIGHVFVLDTLGYVVGGLLFSFCLVHYFSPFQSLTFVMVLSLLSAVLLAMTAGRPALGVVVLAALIVALAAFWNIDVERLTARALYPGQELLHERSTPYGTLAVTRQETQINVYENGVPVGSTQDFVAAEETVHYALAQRPAAKHVLLVSGALTGAIREAAKYPLARIDQVELDPEVLAVVRKISAPEKDPRVVMISEDARRFLRRARGRYDAILMDMPDPSNAQINRYYTAEFFAEAKRALRPGGALSFRLSGSENYAGPEMRRLASSVYRSCASVFKHVLVIPGARRYFLASDEPLDYNIAARLEERRIETRYVHRSYLTAKLTEERIREAKESVSDTVDLNRDFYPTGVHAHLRYWLGHFGGGMAAPGLLVLVIGIGIAALVRASPDRPVSAAISATGFAGMGIEIVLIVAFQICYGYAYRQIGLIVTAFMIGSAAGAAWSARRAGDPRARLARLDGLLAVFAFVLAPALEALRAVDHPLIAAGGPPVIFPVLTGVTGFLGGAQFPLAAKATFQGAEKTFGRLYAVDLLGAAFGSIVISALLIPLIGIAGACYCLGGVKLASAVALRLRRGAPEIAGRSRSGHGRRCPLRRRGLRLRGHWSVDRAGGNSRGRLRRLVRSRLSLGAPCASGRGPDPGDGIRFRRRLEEKRNASDALDPFRRVLAGCLLPDFQMLFQNPVPLLSRLPAKMCLRIFAPMARSGRAYYEPRKAPLVLPRVPDRHILRLPGANRRQARAPADRVSRDRDRRSDFHGGGLFHAEA